MFSSSAFAMAGSRPLHLGGQLHALFVARRSLWTLGRTFGSAVLLPPSPWSIWDCSGRPVQSNGWVFSAAALAVSSEGCL
eukprot:9972632-Alexandrium_andersonii.AAC.1